MLREEACEVLIAVVGVPVIGLRYSALGEPRIVKERPCRGPSRLIPAGSAGKVVYFATILHAQNLKVAALLDADAAGEQAAKQDVLVHTLGNKQILRTKDAYTGPVAKVEIEELLRDTLINIARSELKWDVAVVAAKQKTRPIVEIFQDRIQDFSKYKLAKAFVRWTRSHAASDLTSAERDQWINLINAINRSLAE